MTHRPRWTFSIIAVTLVQVGVTGCGGSKAASAKGPTPDSLPLTLDHEPCDVASSGAEKTDTNGDGTPDIVRVSSRGKEVCRMVDLNHDRKPDAYLYFDDAGALRRRESDFDRDGNLDEIAYYAAAVVVRKDRETNLDGRVDTWDTYQAGQLHQRWRDSDGDGKIDQWWTWPDPSKLECAVIASDRNGDGKPDATGVVDVCSAAATPGPVQTSAADGGAAFTTNAGGSAEAGAVSSAIGTAADGATRASTDSARVVDAGLASTVSATTGVR